MIRYNLFLTLVLLGGYFFCEMYGLHSGVFVGFVLILIWVCSGDTRDIRQGDTRPCVSTGERATEEVVTERASEIPLALLEGLEGSGVFASGFHEIEDKLNRELQMAKNVQQGLLSVETPSIEGIDIAMACVAAENVGGDFYTFIQQEIASHATKAQSLPGVTEYVDTRTHNLGIAIGDVAGHGIASALVMALTSGILRELGSKLQSPAAIFQQANAIICRFIAHSEVPYVTAFYGVLNLESHRFVYSKAGHHPCILLRKNGALVTLETPGVFLGMFEDESYVENDIQLYAGDRLVFYTDGLLEVKNQEGEMLGTDGFISILQATYLLPAEDAKSAIFDQVSHFSMGAVMDDDQTLVILHINDYTA
jgi:sigma-B regulation protein RsbU (phosphoserine phosphatase)